MALLIEILVLAWLVWVAWRIAAGRFVLSFAGLSLRIALLALAHVFGWIAFAIAGMLTRNVVLIALVAAGAGAISYFILSACLHRRLIGPSRSVSDRRTFAMRLDERLRLPGWLNGGLSVGLAVVFVGAAGALVLLIASAVGNRSTGSWRPVVLAWIYDQMHGESANGSITGAGGSTARLSTGTDESADPSVAGTGDPLSFDEATRLQRRLFGGVRSSVDSGADWLMEKTGTDAFVEQFDAMVEISNMPPRQKQWIVDNDPQVHDLITHPKIHRVAGDEKIAAMVDDAVGGSLPAVYRLGDEPAIQAILDDRQLLESIRMIDLAATRDRVREAFVERSD